MRGVLAKKKGLARLFAEHLLVARLSAFAKRERFVRT
jgi:hypothetical protein